ncbi:hypothetical protein AA13595_0067 [Gluconacetobacter johannae DSM 13595]|nr:hypothetical protein AA13595_0067 [Gluconacetobacter johannae DSM 13595]
MDRKKGPASSGPRKTTRAKVAPRETRTDAYADLAIGKDPKEPPVPGQASRHTPGATK